MHAKKKNFGTSSSRVGTCFLTKSLREEKKNTRASALGFWRKKRKRVSLLIHFFSLLLKVFFGVGALGVLFEGVCVVVVVVVVVVTIISTISITTTP